MKINFLGAAKTVTGSCYAIEALGHRFTIDCGMHQGNNAIEERNFQTKLYDPTNIDFVLLTHAHIDHSGLLPRIVAHGFKGPIYCTAPTLDLVSLMLEDSAYIQEMEFKWKLKQKHRRNGTGQKSGNKDDILYTISDAKKAIGLLQPVNFENTFEPVPGIKVTYRGAGHILGAAFIVIEITEEGKTTRLTFSGDLGRPNALLLHDPASPDTTDYLFVESTYGDRNHKGQDDTLKELAEAIDYSYSRQGKVIIPTFAVERAQEIIYSLYLLYEQGKLPKDLPVYLDSPLAIRATDVFLKYSDYLQLESEEHTPYSFKNSDFKVHFTLTTEESQALNANNKPAIILSASGMCNAGRIKHHLKHNLWCSSCSIVFVGYQAVGTLGRKIVDGAESVTVFNEDLNVSAKIFTIGGFSAHADQNQLLEWVGHAAPHNPHVIVIHGDPKAQETFAELIREKYKLQVSIPDYLEEMTLTTGKIPALVQNFDSMSHPHINWEFILSDMDSRMEQLNNQIKSLSSQSWEKQTDAHERIIKLNNEIYTLLSHL